MPMDRRITVSFTTTTRNRAGEAETTTTTRELWATRLQDGVARILDSRGGYSAAARAYRIRYWPDLGGPSRPARPSLWRTLAFRWSCKVSGSLKGRGGGSWTC